MRGVQGEERVEQSRPRAGQPHDEERAIDSFLGDFGVKGPVLRKAQTDGEELEHLPLCEITPEGVQLGIGFQGFEQAAKARPKGILPEVLEARTPPCAS